MFSLAYFGTHSRILFRAKIYFYGPTVKYCICVNICLYSLVFYYKTLDMETCCELGTVRDKWRPEWMQPCPSCQQRCIGKCTWQVTENVPNLNWIWLTIAMTSYTMYTTYMYNFILFIRILLAVELYVSTFNWRTLLLIYIFGSSSCEMHITCIGHWAQAKNTQMSHCYPCF
jgi:hypothetical protein